MRYWPRTMCECVCNVICITIITDIRDTTPCPLVVGPCRLASLLTIDNWLHWYQEPLGLLNSHRLRKFQIFNKWVSFSQTWWIHWEFLPEKHETFRTNMPKKPVLPQLELNQHHRFLGRRWSILPQLQFETDGAELSASAQTGQKLYMDTLSNNWIIPLFCLGV